MTASDRFPVGTAVLIAGPPGRRKGTVVGPIYCDDEERIPVLVERERGKNYLRGIAPRHLRSPEMPAWEALEALTALRNDLRGNLPTSAKTVQRIDALTYAIDRISS